MSEATRPGLSGFGRLGTICTIGTLLTICLSVTPAISQVLYGSIVGVVKDAQGAAVPGATVTVVNKETNLTRDAVTNAEGAYSVINVLPGVYDVKISLQGFREGVRSRRSRDHRPDFPRRHGARSRHGQRNGHGGV